MFIADASTPEGVLIQESNSNELDNVLESTALKPVTCIFMMFVIAFLKDG